jgi:hypothetical protein
METPNPIPQPNKFVKAYKKHWIIYTLIILAIIGYIGSDDKGTTSANVAPAVQPQEQAVPEASLEVNAERLAQDYDDNEVAADKIYKGQRIRVTGTVSEIKKDITDDIYVLLDGINMVRNVQCFLDDENAASKLRKGQTVTLEGDCDGLLMNVILKDCILK